MIHSHDPNVVLASMLYKGNDDEKNAHEDYCLTFCSSFVVNSDAHVKNILEFNPNKSRVGYSNLTFTGSIIPIDLYIILSTSLLQG